jgi:hypothetical protein
MENFALTEPKLPVPSETSTPSKTSTSSETSTPS